MKENKRKPTTHRELTWRIVNLTLALWLVCMILLTWCVASDMLIQVDQKLKFYVDHADARYYRSDESWPGVAECNMIGNLGSPYLWLNLKQLLPIVTDQLFDGYISSNDWMWGKWDIYYGFDLL